MLKQLSKPSCRHLRNRLRKEIADVGCSIEWYKGCMITADNVVMSVRNRSELGEKFRHRTFDSFDPSRNRQAYDSAMQYANGFDVIRHKERNSMIFFGNTGTGKTHLAAAISNHVIDDKHHPVMFGTYIEYLDRIRSEFCDNTEHAKYEMKSLPLLVIDDLGKEKQTAWSDQTLFEIINYRYEHRLPVLITTNLSPDELARRYDKAVISRLHEMCIYVSMIGKDHRVYA